MRIKKIGASAKQGGNKYISSYTVNIGVQEARTCGFFQNEKICVLCKIIDDENEQIIIKPKRITITTEIIDRARALSEDRRREEFKNSPTIIKTMGEMMNDLFEEIRTGKVSKETAALYNYLNTLTVEQLSDLATLMCIGCPPHDAEMNLPSKERFLEYWEYVMQTTIPDSKEDLVDYLAERTNLADYLRDGVVVTNLPIGIEPDTIPVTKWSDMENQLEVNIFSSSVVK